MIINNLTRDNHLKYLNEIFKSAKKIFIISPFITKNINLINFGNFPHLEKITIITTLKPYDVDQYSKVLYFKQLYNILNLKNIEFEIQIDNSLHGKVFIAENNNSVKAVITSANFTDSGLRINNEWGVLINDFIEINKIKNGIIENVKHKSLNELNIDSFLKKIEQTPINQNVNELLTLNLSLLLEYKDNYFDLNNKTTFWLKPIGVTDDLVSLTQKFDLIDSDLHFSKRPSGIKMGDIIVSYAVGHLKILSISKVNSEIKNVNKESRWPFYIVGKNLTPNYGREWMKNNITISNQKNLFLSQTSFNITPSGKNTYGSLMQGADKLKITQEFGKYLLDKVFKIDYELQKI
ncbi:phospholipase D family protein [Chryseobacterium sp.]|uniref:phospholipase D family protein n=1 Tax=Chryseobacterium sp. TaxID=1871047 RepID=UPI002FCBDBD7